LPLLLFVEDDGDLDGLVLDELRRHVKLLAAGCRLHLWYTT
jgi:hypothetical protein